MGSRLWTNPVQNTVTELQNNENMVENMDCPASISKIGNVSAKMLKLLLNSSFLKDHAIDFGN